MFHKLIKNSFIFIVNIIKFIQISLIFLCFFIILYWLMHLAGFPFVEQVTAVFEGIRNFIHIFYQRTIFVNQIEIDLAFLFSVIIALLTIWLLNQVVDYIYDIEKGYNKLHEIIRKKTEDNFNKKLEQEFVLNESKNNKVLYAINFTVKNLNKDKFFNKNVDENVEEKKQKILEDFFELLEGNFEENSKIQENYILINLKIDNIDSKLELLEKLLLPIIKKYKEQNWKINYFAGIDVYEDNNFEIKIKVISKLINLGFENQTLCLPSFKERYLINKHPQYTFESQGIYNIIDKEEVYLLKLLK